MTDTELIAQLRAENEALRRDNQVLQRYRTWYICGAFKVRRIERDRELREGSHRKSN